MQEAAFLEQVRALQGIIYKLVALYASDSEEKKDLYQEILLQAWKSWPSFRGEAKFSTWLYRISLNTILTQQRKTRPVDYRESLEDLALAQPAEPWLAENSQRLQAAIRQLPETDRALLSLHLDGYDNGEIAGLLGITPNYVGVKLHRCKQHLSTLLNAAS